MVESKSNEIILVYHSDKDQDRRMKAYVEAIDGCGVTVKTFDLKSNQLSEQDVEDIAGKLDVEVGDLFDAAGAKKNLPKEEAARLLARDPMLLATPIIIIGEHAYQFESTSEFIHESATISAIRHNPID